MVVGEGGGELRTLLSICSFSGCLIVFVCLFLWWSGLGVHLIVSVPEFTTLLYLGSRILFQFVLRHGN